MDIASVRTGDAVELLVDANAIPAGCYQFLEIFGDMSVFTVGHEVILGLATDFWTMFMRLAVDSGAPLSSEREFAKRYGELYSQLKTKPGRADPSRRTFCMLSPRVFRKCGLDLSSNPRPLYASELLN
jgi:hypothetical protein